MTPSPLRTRRALAAAAALPLLLLSSAACGDDASDAADAVSEAVDTATQAADDATDSASDLLETGDEEIDAALEDLDAMDDDVVLDQVGSAVVSVVSDATGYEVEGGTLYVDMSGDPAGGPSQCGIVQMAAGSLVDDPKVVLRYGSETVECEPL
jgi:hypothetical protein